MMKSVTEVSHAARWLALRRSGFILGLGLLGLGSSSRCTAPSEVMWREATASQRASISVANQAVLDRANETLDTVPPAERFALSALALSEGTTALLTDKQRQGLRRAGEKVSIVAILHAFDGMLSSMDPYCGDTRTTLGATREMPGGNEVRADYVWDHCHLERCPVVLAANTPPRSQWQQSDCLPQTLLACAVHATIADQGGEIGPATMRLLMWLSQLPGFQP